MKMHYSYLKYLTIILMCAFSAQAVSQNYIKSAYVKSTGNSIVRSIDENRRVACTSNANQGKFVFYTDASTSVIVMYLPNTYGAEYVVNDFEVYGNEVFLCGKKINSSGSSTGVIGHFDISLVPPNGLYLCEVEGFANIRRLEVFSSIGEPRLAMIGEGNDSTSYIVDARKNATNTWIFFSSKNFDLNNNRYDDIAVTDSLIVASSRVPGGGFNKYGYLHFYSRPTTNSPFLSGVYKYSKIQYQTFAPILIEACNGSVFTTVTRGMFNLTTIFSAYNNDLHLDSQQIVDSIRECCDIKYNPTTGHTDVLTKYSEDNGIKNEIIHFHFPMTGNSLVFTHRYESYNISSLSYARDVAGGMLAIGVRMTQGQLDFFKYYEGNYTCVNMGIKLCSQISNNLNLNSKSVSSAVFTKSESYYNCQTESLGIYSICETKVSDR